MSTITTDPLYQDERFTALAHDPTASAYNSEGVIETPADRIHRAIREIEAANARRARPIPPPPNVRAGFARGYVAEVNSPNSSRPKRRTPTGHAPNQTAPIGLVRTAATRAHFQQREIDRLMRQPRS